MLGDKPQSESGYPNFLFLIIHSKQMSWVLRDSEPITEHIMIFDSIKRANF